MQLLEHPFTCPYCWESITMLVDLSVLEQHYVEDCEVCCHPIGVHVGADGETVTSFEARRLD